MYLRRFTLCFLTMLLVGSALLSFGSDEQKAQKQANKITAMATTNATARTIVSATMADMLSLPRNQLVRERRAMHLNYGALFIAHQLSLGGAKMLDIALELPTGKSIFQIGEAQNANWKTIADAAKKLNGKIEDNIYKHFLHAEADAQRVLEEHYDADSDIVRSDVDTPREEIAQAFNTYRLWRDRAAPIGGRGLDTASTTDVGKNIDVFKGGERQH